jgi:acetyl-CoA C-acetyltransferase
MSGQQDLVVGGGVESMSRVPMGSDDAMMDGLNTKLRRRLYQVPQGISADLIATLDGLSREELDRFALESQRRAALAIAEGRFAKSLVPVVDAEGKRVLERDEHPRPETTLDGLAALEPAFLKLGAAVAGPDGETLDQLALKRYPDAKAISHVHHAGNSSGIVDGAAAVLFASEAYVERTGVKPRARIRSVATLGSEPVIMLTAPAPVSERALKKAGMKASDIDLWENQRSLRSGGSRHDSAPRARSRTRERQWRCDRTRASARCDGRHVARNGSRRARAARQSDGARHAVHRGRHGYRDRHRARLSFGLP